VAVQERVDGGKLASLRTAERRHTRQLKAGLFGGREGAGGLWGGGGAWLVRGCEGWWYGGVTVWGTGSEGGRVAAGTGGQLCVGR
jgi:hypothetical protein